jgi:hypothetical protein
MLALQQHREEVTLALQNRPGFDIATVSEDEFAEGLARLKIRQQRMQKILDTVLIDGVHYGNPKTKGGRPAFKKPMLLQPGVEELQRLFRLTPRHAEPPIITVSEAFASVTVQLDLVDSAGRVVATRSGNCNTIEKRFEKQAGGYTYTDAREMVHNCLAMAEKRALKLAVSAATGATAFFAAEEEMDKALAEPGADPEEEKREPWTADAIKRVRRAAFSVGMKTRDELKVFIQQTLGRVFVGTGDDVAALLEALKRRPAPGVGTGEYDEPKAAAAPPAADSKPAEAPATAPTAAEDVDPTSRLDEDDDLPF